MSANSPKDLYNMRVQWVEDDGNIDYNEFDKFCSAEKPLISSVKNVLRKYYF